MKYCTGCDTTKPFDKYFRNKASKSGYTYRCKDCIKFYQDSNLKRRSFYSRRDQLKKYGLTLDDYEMMFTEQGGVCHLCERSVPKNLCVDHCHKTGAIRKLLCLSCNTALGNFQEDTELMLRAINYLREHKMKEEEEVGIPVLVSNFMKEYEAKVEEVELPLANQYVDDVLLPKYTSDLSPELLDAFVDGVKGPINTLLQGHMKDLEKDVQDVTEDA